MRGFERPSLVTFLFILVVAHDLFSQRYCPSEYLNVYQALYYLDVNINDSRPHRPFRGYVTRSVGG
jgi:hypothetical protein